MLPGYFTGARARVGEPCKCEEQIRQSVQIDDDDLRDLDLALKVNHSPLRATTNRARDVKRRSFRSSARKDERFQRLELAVARVDCQLELGNTILADASLGEMLLHLFRIRCGEQGSDAEEVALNWNEDFIYCGHVFGGACDAEERVQFIYVAVGFDARVIFGNAPAAKQAGKALVAGLRVDLHRS